MSSSPITLRGPQESPRQWLADQKIAVVESVTSYIVEVTPEIAEAWLSLNVGNRKPSAAKIRRFAALAQDGKWVINGETIKFSSDGKLLDGQSRLRAIVQSGVSARLEIRFGIGGDAQKTMDCGETRKATHTLEMLGEKNAEVLSPTLRLLFKLENGGLGSGGGKGRMGVMENLIIPQLLGKHRAITASVSWAVEQGQRMRRFMPLSEAAFFHYVFARAGVPKRDSFFSGLNTPAKATRPVALLKARMQDCTQGRLASGLRIKLVVKAWNAHATGQHLHSLVLAPRESVAMIHGIQGDAVLHQKANDRQIADVEEVIANAAL